MADTCTAPIRIDGRQHSWSFDGDDPRIVCLGCGQVRDALSGRILGPAPTPEETGQ